MKNKVEEAMSSLSAKPARQLAMVFAIALAVRAACVLHYGPILTNDSNFYLAVAQGIRNGEGMGLPYRAPPVYPLFLAAVLAICQSHGAIIWAQALLGSITCVVLAACCQRLFQPKLAFWLGLIVAFFLPTAGFCVMVLRETLIGFAVSLTTYCLVRSSQERNHFWFWATGVSCAFTVFCQPTFIVFPLWLGVVYWLASRDLKLATRAVLPVAVCLGVTIGLWGMRNYLVTSHFIPISADHLGYFFLEGIMDANSNKGPKALSSEQVRYLGLREDDPYIAYETLRDHYWGIGKESGNGGLERKLQDGPILFSRALRLVAHEPGRYLRFSLKRLHRLWFKDVWLAREEPNNLNLRPLDRFREKGGLAASILVLVIYGFGYSSLFGIFLYWRNLVGLLVPPITFLSFHMWVHAETRYVLAIHPHLLIFSVLAIVSLWQVIVRHRPISEIKAAVLR